MRAFFQKTSNKLHLEMVKKDQNLASKTGPKNGKKLPKTGGLAFTRVKNNCKVLSWAMGVFWCLPALVTHKR
jgi:hypothetical protein